MITITAQELTPTRHHPRVDARFPVQVTWGGRTTIAEATDLSLAGLRLEGERYAEGEFLTLMLVLPEGTGVLLEGVVTRRLDDGAAVEFGELDWDDLLALARFVHPRLG